MINVLPRIMILSGCAGDAVDWNRKNCTASLGTVALPLKVLAYFVQ